MQVFVARYLSSLVLKSSAAICMTALLAITNFSLKWVSQNFTQGPRGPLLAAKGGPRWSTVSNKSRPTDPSPLLNDR